MLHDDIVPPARRGRVPVSDGRDGRQLGFSEWGREDGRVVLFATGAGMSSALGFGASALDRLGVRLIALDRPGLGASDPQPGRSLASWAENVAAFVTRRGLSNPRIVGFSQGAPFALACAHAGVVTAAAIVSGSDELAAPEHAERLAPELRRLIDDVARDPRAAEAFFATMTPAMLRDMVLGGSGEADRAIYADPHFDAAYRQALAEGFAQGAAGYARDTLLAMSRWPFDLGAVRVRVDLWYGAHDASPVHSPDGGRLLASRLPEAHHRLLPDAGGALPWTHGAAILEALLA